jgi:hypothetical protein
MLKLSLTAFSSKIVEIDFIFYSDSGEIVARTSRYLAESDIGDTIPLEEMTQQKRKEEKSIFDNQGFS